MSLKPQQYEKELRTAVGSFDRQAAAALCGKLVEHLHRCDEAFPLDRAKSVLYLLERKRYFDLVQRFADALIRSSQDAPVIWRYYALSFLELGNLTAGILILEKLSRDTAPGAGAADARENAEARRLLGRFYTQLYVQAPQPRKKRSRSHLERAIVLYHDVYRDNASQIWAGISCVALLRMARLDGVEVQAMADAELLARSMAAEILTGISRLKAVAAWDSLVACEACVALGQYQQALEWLSLSLRADTLDAMELESYHRDLTELWRLEPSSPPGDRLIPAMRSALMRRQGSAIEIPTAEVCPAVLAALAQDGGYEKVLGADGFRTFKWWRIGEKRAGSVARIDTATGAPVGTGFVVRGGDLRERLGDELLVLTNSHVTAEDPSISRGLHPNRIRVSFEVQNCGCSERIELDRRGLPHDHRAKQVWTSPPKELDATLLRLTPTLKGLVPLPLNALLEPQQRRAYIIGYPQGRPLSISVHDNLVLDFDDRFVHYRSPTEPGSSGSPVFNEDWEVVALHHGGRAQMPRLHGREGTYPANEGIRVQAIREALARADLG